MKIKRAYVRHYSDNGQTKAYVEWEDGSRTEGEASHRTWRPNGMHMNSLFLNAERQGLKIEYETW